MESATPMDVRALIELLLQDPSRVFAQLNAIDVPQVAGQLGMTDAEVRRLQRNALCLIRSATNSEPKPIVVQLVPVY